MSKTAVVYWSGTGNTEAMANAIASGVREAGGEASLIPAADFTPADVAGYDAIALGCPSMGAEELEDGEFLPMYEAVKGALSGKKTALFGSYGWGDGEWMRNWQKEAEDGGMLLVAEGLIINEAPDDEGIAACKALGKKLA